MHPAHSTPSATSQDREARIQDLMQRLRPAADQALRQMAERLVDAPDRQLFGDLELALRDLAHDLAATAHQTGLADRKKGGTKAPAASAPSAATTPSSKATSPERS